MDFFKSCIIYYSYKGNFVLFQMMPYTCSYMTTGLKVTCLFVILSRPLHEKQ